jgi:hypothetical protein
MCHKRVLMTEQQRCTIRKHAEVVGYLRIPLIHLILILINNSYHSHVHQYSNNIMNMVPWCHHLVVVRNDMCHFIILKVQHFTIHMEYLCHQHRIRCMTILRHTNFIADMSLAMTLELCRHT